MNLAQFKDKVIENVVQPMLDFIDGWDECDYGAEDVESCRKLLFDYLEAVAGMQEPSDEEIMDQVKRLVLALNELNEKTDFSLIETEAREEIWEIIQTSAVECGLKEYSDDITEEWRDW